jgi:hypothetical protein
MNLIYWGNWNDGQCRWEVSKTDLSLKASYRTEAEATNVPQQ